MNISEFFKDTRGELRHVTWPSRKATIAYTAIVIILSVVIAYFLGLFDFLFTQGLQRVIF